MSFRKGDRVKVFLERENGWPGIVASNPRSDMHVRVRRDGLKTVNTYHINYVKKLEDSK